MKTWAHRECPVCGGPYEYVAMYNQRRIGICSDCTHVFVATPLVDEEYRKMFQGQEAFTRNYGHLGINSINDHSLWEGWVSNRMNNMKGTLGLNDTLRSPLRIAEVGCLEGRFLTELAAHGHEVMGCDLNHEVISIGRKEFGMDLRAGTICECMPIWGSFDLVLAIHVLHFWPCPMTELASWVRLLAPGGRLLIDLPLNRTDYQTQDCMQYFNEQSARTLLETFFPHLDFHMHPVGHHAHLHKDTGTFVGYL